MKICSMAPAFCSSNRRKVHHLQLAPARIDFLFHPTMQPEKNFPARHCHYSEVLTRAQAGERQHRPKAARELTAWLREKLVAQQFEVEMAFRTAHGISAIVESAPNISIPLVLADLNEDTETCGGLGRADIAGATMAENFGLTRIEHVGVLLPNDQRHARPLSVLCQPGKSGDSQFSQLAQPFMRVCAEIGRLNNITSHASSNGQN